MGKHSSRLRSAILELKPWAYWRFNDTVATAEGGTGSRDQSGNERTAEYRNSPTIGSPLSLATGDPARSVAFTEAAKSYVKAVGVNPFSGVKTFFFLVRRSSTHASGDSFFHSSQGSGNYVMAYIAEGTSNIRLTCNGFGTTPTWEGAWPGDDQVVDLAFVINPSTLKATLYVNGVSKGEKTIAAYGAEPKEIRIGHDGFTGGVNYSVNANFQDFAIFDGALTAEQIAALHSARVTAPEALSTRRYWGADMDGDVVEIGSADAPYSTIPWDAFEGEAEAPVGIVHFANPWRPVGEGVEGKGGPVWDGYGAGGALRVIQRGAIPLITLGSDSAGVIQRVNEGKYDAGIDRWAEDVMAFGHPIFVRPWWEFNMTNVWAWNPPGATAAEYVEAWKRLVTRVRAIADNVTFYWCANFVENSEGEAKLATYYPGDDYVDWVGFDGYTSTNPIKSYGWREPYVLFGRTESALKALAPGKPIMIGEVAASETGGSKAGWITKLMRGDGVDQLPRVRAIVWFNWNIEHKPGERIDWPIGSSASSREAFAAAVASPLYSDPPYAADSPFVRPHATILPITPIVSIASGPASQDPAEEVSFVFAADDEDATFEYRLDGGEWQAVTSPLRVTNLSEREHLLEVRAIDDDGFAGPITDYEWRRPGTRVIQPGEVPKLRVPLQVVDGRLATVQQDSPDNVGACVFAVLAYERGARLEDPDFGVDSRLFDQLPVDVDEWLEQIAAYEPRASVSTQQDIEESMGLVLIEVGLTR